MMIKPNWDVFKAKFSENPQENFEWLCYLLFCKEFNKNIGIFRYKNQAGVETNPVAKGKEVIGWQAKFYTTNLSANKNELIEALIKSKERYPSLTKMIFYTNQEWGQSRDKEENSPKGKVDIEKKGEELGLEIVWNQASFFDSPFVVIDNQLISQYFFEFDNGIIQVLKNRIGRTETILKDIQNVIYYENEKLDINRKSLFEEIIEKMKTDKVLMITGEGGVGKTAVIKSLYNDLEDKFPFYVFKANEFNINSISDLFDGHSIQDFIAIHEDDKKKVIVVDSAEMLLDLTNTDPFKEFIYELLQNDWKILFTARTSYLSDLDMRFIDQYQVKVIKFYIHSLSEEDLVQYSRDLQFNLPKDRKLLELIKTPFYLNEFLKFNTEESIDFTNFKESLWNKVIKKSQPNREQCFMDIAFQRAVKGQFFIIPHNISIADSLVQDNILGYETTGYFITHDIYEEWALEKIIESEFIRQEDHQKFLKEIGESLPIRRSFRKWISNKNLAESESIKDFIDEVIEDDSISSFWKDELLVSILLSPQSEFFINFYEKKMLENNHELLKRCTFLLRIACKEVDESLIKLYLDTEKYNHSHLLYFFNKPIGTGWKTIISFIYNHIHEFDMRDLSFILPIINEWNKSFKDGSTTRLSSLIAFSFYETKVKEDDKYFREEDIEEELIQTILYGASEIKEELTSIFNQVLENEWKNYREPYFSLISNILTSPETNTEVLKTMPEHVLKLASLYWFTSSEKKLEFESTIGTESYFCIEKNGLNYYPASAYQTPIYHLLHISYEMTMKFLLKFINSSVECYSVSKLADHDLDEIEIHIDDQTVKQYLSSRLWLAYRGAHSTPDLFDSIHMALEKFLLIMAENTDSKILENNLIYLLKNSKSSSITAIVTSIVLAYPNKTFNVLKILFKTKELFFLDTERMVFDLTAKMNFSIGMGLGGKNDFYLKERIESCEDSHRKLTLENIILHHQFFRDKSVTEEEATKRQNEIWEIIDMHYEMISNDVEYEYNTWRLFLARMDRREMSPKIEETEAGVAINFNPTLDSDLEEYSESYLKESSEKNKYVPLKLWADYRFKGNEEYKDYSQYEENPLQALTEMKVLMSEEVSQDGDKYKEVPANVSSVLLRDYFNLLSTEDKDFCKEIILEYASYSFRPNYLYHISDGVEASFSMLPFILKKFPQEKNKVKRILLLTLFDSNTIGQYAKFFEFSSETISTNLWDINFNDAQSLFTGFLKLKPEYDLIKDKKVKKEGWIGSQTLGEDEVVKDFEQEFECELKEIYNNMIEIDDIEFQSIKELDLNTLNVAFQLLPLRPREETHMRVLKIMINTFAQSLNDIANYQEIDYDVINDFKKVFTRIVLQSNLDEISVYIDPFIEGFNNNGFIAELLQDFIYTEDRLKTYTSFWHVWELFYDKVKSIFVNESNSLNKNRHARRDNQELIESYLFSRVFWKDDVTEWHAFKEQDKSFFNKISRDMGDSSYVLEALSRLLAGPGQIYNYNGITWISRMINENPELWSKQTSSNAIFYLEKVIRLFIYENRRNIKRETKLKKKSLIILDFLIEKGSVTGYLLREDIL